VLKTSQRLVLLLVLVLVAAPACHAQTKADADNSPAANGQRQTVPPSPAPPPYLQVIQVEPSPKAIAIAADQESAKRRFFGFEPDGWVAIFTGLLFVATVILAAVSVFQIKFLINADRKAAEQIKLAREEFAATHRPRVILRGFDIRNRDIPDGEPVRYVFVAHNVGDADARLVETRTATIILKDAERIPGNLSFPDLEPLSYTLAAGEHVLIPGNGGTAPEPGESMGVYANKLALICLGTLTYLDANNVRREAGFCRRYRPREDIWDIIRESEYEYAY
jgi:hypothetical protein